MTIARILQQRNDAVISVETTATIAAVVGLLAQHRIGAVPVMDGGRVAGILSERDVVHRLASDGAALLDRTAAAVMTAPAIVIGSDIPVLGALSLMTRRRIRHLPVVDDGRMIGFVSIGDLVKFRMDGIEAEATAMRDYIAGA